MTTAPSARSRSAGGRPGGLALGPLGVGEVAARARVGAGRAVRARRPPPGSPAGCTSTRRSRPAATSCSMAAACASRRSDWRTTGGSQSSPRAARSASWRGLVLGTGVGRVEVLDPQQERAAGRAGEQPRQQRRAQVARRAATPSGSVRIVRCHRRANLADRTAPAVPQRTLPSGNAHQFDQGVGIQLPWKPAGTRWGRCDRRHRAGGEVLGGEHDEVGRRGGGVVHVREQPAVVLGRWRRRGARTRPRRVDRVGPGSHDSWCRLSRSCLTTPPAIVVEHPRHRVAEPVLAPDEALVDAGELLAAVGAAPRSDACRRPGRSSSARASCAARRDRGGRRRRRSWATARRRRRCGRRAGRRR